MYPYIRIYGFMSVAAVPILDTFSAVADPTRCRMLWLLEQHELTVTELCSVLQLPQSTVSRHLKTLADAGWVGSRRDGTSRYYGLALEGGDGAHARIWQLTREQLAGRPGVDQDGKRLLRVLARRGETSKQFFASSAGQWDRVRQELFGHDISLRALAALLPPTWVVGDLGCGTGVTAGALAPFDLSSTGRVRFDGLEAELADFANARSAACDAELLAVVPARSYYVYLVAAVRGKPAVRRCRRTSLRLPILERRLQPEIPL